ncbi:hypothetical protein AB0D71_16580 [Streptomyces avermitilis]
MPSARGFPGRGLRGPTTAALTSDDHGPGHHIDALARTRGVERVRRRA